MDTTTTEEWKAMKGYEGLYEARRQLWNIMK